jgi:alkanesulfonate monooxygenase SsuD/methylene tetrahydromethanopterin reductase-like flavin-dependent oxidoreductase (luciferase family)
VVEKFTDAREDAEAGALYGTPDRIAAKLEALRDVGAEYVLLYGQDGLASLRRFARELMPAFDGEPVLRTAV